MCHTHAVASDSLWPHGHKSIGILQARILEWVAYAFSSRSSPTQELNWGLLHCRQILYQLSYQGSQNFKWPLYSRIIGCNTFYLLLLLRFQDILNLTFCKLKEITLLTFPERMLPLKKSTTTKPLAWSKEIFPQVVTFRKSIEVKHCWPQRRENKTRNSTIVGLTKRGSSGLDQITTQS